MKFPHRLARLLLVIAGTAIICFGAKFSAKKATVFPSPAMSRSAEKPLPALRLSPGLSTSFFDNKTVAKAVTDEDGNYKLTGLPAGKFGIFPLAKAYVKVGAGNLGGIRT